MNSKLGRQHTKAPLAAALSPFLSLLYPPNPWCEWCDEWRLTTTPGSTSPTLFEQWCEFFNYVPKEPDKCKCCETGPTVFRPYPKSETIWRVFVYMRKEFTLRGIFLSGTPIYGHRFIVFVHELMHDDRREIIRLKTILCNSIWFWI